MLKKIVTALISFVRSGLMGFLPTWIIGAMYVPFFILFLKGDVVKVR
jgi:ABC-type xylose transport system permease subunit